MELCKSRHLDKATTSESEFYLGRQAWAFYSIIGLDLPPIHCFTLSPPVNVPVLWLMAIMMSGSLASLDYAGWN